MPRFALYLLLTVLPLAGLNAEVLQLKNGDLISGQIISEKGDQILFAHPLLGHLKINKADITSQVSTPGQAINSKSVNAVELSILAASEHQAPVLSKIVLRVEVGFSGATGNSRNTDLRLGYQRRSESKQRHTFLKSGYQRETSDGDTDENEFFAELTYDWLLAQSRWFRFAQGRYDWDDFEDWDSRVTVSAGSGYHFIDRTGLRLTGRLGLGLTQTLGGEDDDLNPETMIGVDANWQINSRQSLEFANNLALQLDEFGELRNLTSLGWLIKLDQFNGIDLKLGIDNEYESDSAGTSS